MAQCQAVLPVLWTIPPILRTFPPNRPKWVHFRRALPYSAKKSPFPGIKKAGRERTLSGQMTPILHFFSSEGRLLLIPLHILTFHSFKHAKRTTQASYQNLGGYMWNDSKTNTIPGYRFAISLSFCNGCIWVQNGCSRVQKRLGGCNTGLSFSLRRMLWVSV